MSVLYDVYDVYDVYVYVLYVVLVLVYNMISWCMHVDEWIIHMNAIVQLD